jgi:ribosomal protein L7/L12
MLEVANVVLGLVLLISGIAATDWVRLIAGALVVVGATLALWGEIRAAPPSPGLSADEARAEVMSVAVAGDRIKAVRVLRERTGLGLVDATETVRRWLEEEGITWR